VYPPVEDIDIIGSWQTDGTVFTITNEDVTISNYAWVTVIKYDNDNDNDYVIVFFDEHVSPGVHQKYLKLEWINLNETSVTLNIYKPQDFQELAETATSIFETHYFTKI
jgi:hypothetical protein